MSASPPGSAGGSVRVCSRSGSSRTARAGFHRAAARRNTRRGSVSSSLCVRLVAGAGGKPAPPPHAAGARGFFGSLPRLLLAVHELSHEGRTLGLADDEAAPHHVRALRRPDTGPARGYLPSVPSGARCRPGGLAATRRGARCGAPPPWQAGVISRRVRAAKYDGWAWAALTARRAGGVTRYYYCR